MAGTPRAIEYLEGKFETGDIPTQQDFYDLFYSPQAKYLNASLVPFSSLSAANTYVPASERYRGKTVLIGSIEYWWRDGTADGDLVPKIGGSFPNTYFVSPLGNDTTGNKGDIARPFTPAGAAALAVAGDTIAFLPGEYNISSSIAKSGVNYITFGGAAYITNNTTGVYVWDYNFSGVTIGATISGDFHYILNAASGGILKCHDAFGSNLTYTFRFATADITDGNFIVLPRTGRASLFDGSVNISGGMVFTGPLSLNLAEGLGSSINIRISSTSANAVCSFRTSNYKYDISYLSTTGPLSNNDITSSSINNLAIIKVNQPGGKTTYLPLGASSCSLRGGEYIIINSGKAQITGELYNCTFTSNPAATTTIDGYFDNVIFYNNQSTLLEIDGVSNNCTHSYAGVSELTIIKGKHFNIDFGSSIARLRVEGQIHLLAGSQLVVNNASVLIISGLIVADVSTSAVLLNQSGGYSEIMAGKLKNKHASGVCITNTAGAVPTLRLEAAKIFSNNGSETILVNTASSGNINLELLNKSYANIGITNAPNYIFEPAGNYFVDANLTIQEI